MSMVDYLCVGGYEVEVNVYEDCVLKFVLRVKNWEKVNVNGCILLKLYFEDGIDGVFVIIDMVEKLEFCDGGGINDVFNLYIG